MIPLKHMIALALSLLAASAALADEPKPVKPVNLTVNTDKDESEPHLSSSGLALLYTSSARGKRDLLMSTRANRGQPWPAGQPLLDGHGQAEFRGGYLTTDGRYPQYLYFATDHDPVNEKEQKGNNFDVYFLIRQRAGADFTTRTPLHAVCTGEDELHPWLSADGLRLFFSRKTKDGWRVCVADRPRTGGAFGQPRTLDLPAGFHHPTLTPDGRTLYVQGPLENGRWGLFRATAAGKGWAKPEPLDTLNSAAGPTGDLAPSLSRDGTLLYFASDRPGGKGGLDVWGVSTAALKK